MKLLTISIAAYNVEKYLKSINLDGMFTYSNGETGGDYRG